MKKLVFPIPEQKRVINLVKRQGKGELRCSPNVNPFNLGVLAGRNGHFVIYDKATQVAIRDSKGIVHVFDKKQKSCGVNNRLYFSYSPKNYEKAPKKAEKPLTVKSYLQKGNSS